MVDFVGAQNETNIMKRKRKNALHSGNRETKMPDNLDMYRRSGTL